MPAHIRITTILIALALAGCSSRLPVASAGNASGGGFFSSNATRQEALNDPSLNMTAAIFNIPAKWHFQGVLMQGGACISVPFIVFRATSPDGLSFVEQIPSSAWVWGTGPAANVKHEGCLPLKQAIGAQEFLKYISATLNVEYVADQPVPEAVNAKAQKAIADAKAVYAPSYADMHTQAPNSTRELAWASVRYKNGSFTMKGRLQGLVDCTETSHPGVKSILRGMPDQPAWSNTGCQAAVRFISAPEDKFQAVADMLEAANIGSEPNQAWIQAWLQRNNQQSQQMINQMNAAASARLRASAQQFNHDQAVRQQMHEQFLSTMQRGTDMSMQRAADVANSNHRMAQDVVDYALDRQTVRDPATGQISKVSSSSTYTWIDSTGKTSFQTNDVNANPNGSLSGNWTRQQVVHGDGSQ